ncbi:MAG: ABC transporter permease, partial [Saprospiraceae bacterium]|nr:ABC transporter permease [Saprospiraceae bacterium]
ILVKFFDFNFLERQTSLEVNRGKNQALSLVISKKAAAEYFGESQSYLGKMVTLEGKKFNVIGVVKTMQGPQGFNADVIIPYTNMNVNQLENENGFQGRFQAIFWQNKKR